MKNLPHGSGDENASLSSFPSNLLNSNIVLFSIEFKVVANGIGFFVEFSFEFSVFVVGVVVGLNCPVGKDSVDVNSSS